MCAILFCLALLLWYLFCFHPAIYHTVGESGVGTAPVHIFGRPTPRYMLLPVSNYTIILFDVTVVLPSLLLIFISLCGVFVVVVLAFMSGLSYAAYMVALLP